MTSLPRVPRAKPAGSGVGMSRTSTGRPKSGGPDRGDVRAADAAYADAADTALADPDPWHAFGAHLERICAMQAADRGFTHVLTMTFPTAKALEADRDRAYRGLVELIARARATGRLRADLVPEDVVLLLMANAGVVSATADAAPNAWRRMVAYLI
jgi:hypothetical protein